MSNETETLELELDLRERLKIDPAELDREFIECPTQIAYLGAKHARAIGEHLRAEIRRKKLWGLLQLQAREDLEGINDEAQAREARAAEAEGRKPKDVRVRVTESMVEARAQQMPQWQDAQEDEVAAEVAREQAKSNLLAALAKKDMLVQMGANHRAELERDPAIRERARISRSND